MDKLSLAQILDEAQDLLVKTFNRNELRQLLLSKMGVNLDDIAPNATGNKDLIFEVLTWMDRRGSVHEFIKFAAADRPKIPEWHTLLKPGSDPQSSDEVTALVRGYMRLRRVLPDGSQKTVQLQALVNQLLALPLGEYDLSDRFHLSESDGERLVAVLTLVRRPDPRYLRWLSERPAVETLFVGYQAAVALWTAAETLPQVDLDAVTAAVEGARKWIPQAERPNEGQWKKLGQALEVIAKRSAGGSRGSPSH